MKSDSAQPYLSNALWNDLAERSDRLVWNLDASKTASDWLESLENRRSVFRRNLGLDPWPATAGVPLTRNYGEFQGAGFRAKKLGYQLAPSCWGSATMYYPDPLPSQAVPGILYLCGHTQTGSHHFHGHPVMWARRGYVCLIVDTIEQNDNLAEHHGFNVHQHHSRLALGITASGLELFNSRQALEILAADPAVDAERLGVTGVSGGGAMSFFLAAFDERIRAVSTLCGICSARDALLNGHLFGHCDCMFPLGIEPMDTAEIAALIAPRAALFCFGRDDELFHIEESVRTAESARQVWNLLGVPERWKLQVTDCPHGDHPEFDHATQCWFDTHLLGETRPILQRNTSELAESVTCVFQGVPPTPNHLHLLEEILIPQGRVRLPTDPSEWPEIRSEALARLQTWMPPDEPVVFSSPATWNSRMGAKLTYHGRMRNMGISLRLTIAQPDPEKLLLSVVSGGEGFQNVTARTASIRNFPMVAHAVLEPRLSGWNYPGVESAAYPAGNCFEVNTRMAKAMSLLGLTPIATFVQDIRAAIPILQKQMPTLPLYLHGQGESAVAALLVALTDENIAGVVLENLPWSFMDRSAVIGALRVLDIHHAVGLMAPRTVALIGKGDGNWSWPVRAYRRLECAERFLFAASFQDAIRSLFPSE